MSDPCGLWIVLAMIAFGALLNGLSPSGKTRR